MPADDLIALGEGLRAGYQAWLLALRLPAAADDEALAAFQAEAGYVIAGIQDWLALDAWLTSGFFPPPAGAVSSNPPVSVSESASGSGLLRVLAPVTSGASSPADSWPTAWHDLPAPRPLRTAAAQERAPQPPGTPDPTGRLSRSRAASTGMVGGLRDLAQLLDAAAYTDDVSPAAVAGAASAATGFAKASAGGDRSFSAPTRMIAAISPENPPPIGQADDTGMLSGADLWGQAAAGRGGRMHVAGEANAHPDEEAVSPSNRPDETFACPDGAPAIPLPEVSPVLEEVARQPETLPQRAAAGTAVSAPGEAGGARPPQLAASRAGGTPAVTPSPGGYGISGEPFADSRANARAQALLPEAVTPAIDLPATGFSADDLRRLGEEIAAASGSTASAACAHPVPGAPAHRSGWMALPAVLRIVSFGRTAPSFPAAPAGVVWDGAESTPLPPAEGIPGPEAVRHPAVTGPAERPAVTGPAERPAVTGPAERPAVTGPAERPAVTGPAERPAAAAFSEWDVQELLEALKREAWREYERFYGPVR
ncbi:MAG: hypothetical protein ACOYYS_12900 [Chloroflexota bacterium]